MKHLVSSEALKLRTLRLPWAMALIGAALSGVIGFVMVKVAVDTGETVSLADIAAGPAQPMWFFTVIVAVLATAGEFQHRTIQTTLLQAPRRGPVLAAKMIVLAAYGAALATLGAAAAAATGAVAMRGQGLHLDTSADLWRGVAGSVLLGALWAVLAASLGTLVRSSTVALVTVLVWKFVIENVIPLVTGAPEIRRWMPSTAAEAALYGGGDTTYLAPAAGALLFIAYTAAIALAGTLTFLRTDPT